MTLPVTGSPLMFFMYVKTAATMLTTEVTNPQTPIHAKKPPFTRGLFCKYDDPVTPE
ncbi:hypothetical protein GYMC10_2907 [Paenibacillus sp. Y412MC10]|nr:hypothetical protein GYMC10_2907 [Paenibacillus sp. Y412MC10]